MLQTIKHNDTGWGSARRNPDFEAKFPPKNLSGCDRPIEDAAQTSQLSSGVKVPPRIPTLTPENPLPLPACGGGWGWWWRWSGDAWHDPAAWYPGWFPLPDEWKRILVKYQAPAMKFSGDKKPLSSVGLQRCQLSSPVNTTGSVGNYQPVQDQGQKCYWQEKSMSPPFQRPERKCCSPFVQIFQPCL